MNYKEEIQRIIKNNFNSENAANEIYQLFISEPKDEQNMNIKIIKRVVSHETDIPAVFFKRKTRKAEIVRARQLAMYFASKKTKNSLGSIAEQVGNRGHATAIYSCKTIKNMIDTDKEFKRFVKKIEDKLEEK